MKNKKKNKKRKGEEDYEDYSDIRKSLNRSHKGKRIKDKSYLKDVLDGNIDEDDYYDYNNQK